MAHSRAGAGNVQDASGASWCNRHLGSASKTKKKPKLHNDEGISEGHQEPTKRTTQGQNWKNLSNKI